MTTPATKITPQLRAQEERALEDLSQPVNWGKWGPDDELGCLNYIDPEKIVQAVALVRRGRSYSLAHPIRHQGGSPIAYGRPEPRLLFQYDGADWATGFGAGRREAREAVDDTIILPIHGTCTHIDALSHYWTAGTMYNGFSGALVNSFGAQKLGVEKIHSIITRGVLLDMARYRGADVMEGTDLITEADIAGCAEAQGVTIGRGDAVLVHTGFPTLYYEERRAGYRHPPRFNGPQPGVGPSAIRYLAGKEISLLGADNISVHWRSGSMAAGGRYQRHWMKGEGDSDDPRRGLGDEGSVDLHVVMLRNLGLVHLELADLAPIAADQVYEFLFIVAPIPIKGASGSPVNPLAVV